MLLLVKRRSSQESLQPLDGVFEAVQRPNKAVKKLADQILSVAGGETAQKSKAENGLSLVIHYEAPKLQYLALFTCILIHRNAQIDS